MNLPNKLTVLRIALVPVLALVWIFPYAQFGIVLPTYHIGHVTLPLLNLIALGIFAFASFTDFLDGNIARKRNLVTTFGKFADPIADKLLCNTMMLFLAIDGMLPAVPVFIMLSRDTIVDGCRMIASRNGVVIAAGYLGKTKTVLQMFALIFTLLNNLPFELYSIPVSTVLIWLAAIVSAASGYSYFMQVHDFIFESM